LGSGTFDDRDAYAEDLNKLPVTGTGKVLGKARKWYMWQWAEKRVSCSQAMLFNSSVSSIKCI